MVTKAMHPLVKQIERGKREKHISNAKIARALYMSERSLYRRYLNPRLFSIDELEDLAVLFNWRQQALEKFVEARRCRRVF